MGYVPPALVQLRDYNLLMQPAKSKLCAYCHSNYRAAACPNCGASLVDEVAGMKPIGVLVYPDKLSKNQIKELRRVRTNR